MKIVFIFFYYIMAHGRGRQFFFLHRCEKRLNSALACVYTVLAGIETLIINSLTVRQNGVTG